MPPRRAPRRLVRRAARRSLARRRGGGPASRPGSLFPTKRDYRVYRQTRSAMFRTYTQEFNLQPQYILADQSTVGNVVITGSDSGPLKSPNLFIYPAQSHLAASCDLAFGITNAASDITYSAATLQLYDAFRINSIKLEITTGVNTSAGLAGILPTVYLYADQDSAAVPATVASLTGKMGVVRHDFSADGVKAVIVYKPLISPVASSNTGGGVFPTVIPWRSEWLNATNLQVPHFGLKGFITDFFTPGVTAYSGLLKFQWTYNVSFRSPIVNT